MQQNFSNNTPVLIPSDVPTDASSPIQVSGTTGSIQRVAITLDIDHTYTSDLRIILRSPGGIEVLLVAGQGGSGDNFRFTTFADSSRTSIDDALPPFSGTFRPIGTLSDLNGANPNGEWSLIVQDTARLDGGSLNGWTLSLTLEETVQSNFEVQITFAPGQFSVNQRAVFEAAAQRWSEIILGDPSVSGRSIVSIGALSVRVGDLSPTDPRADIPDGPGRTLAAAGPRSFRDSSGLPASGEMIFDRDDITILEANGGLFTTVLHEMCHVFGLGTLWTPFIRFLGGQNNPVFMGTNSMREFATLVGSNSPQPVPIANTGGDGTFGGHWRESVFGTEAMTGFINNGVVNPVSRMTIASLADLGYTVNYNAADPYQIPTSLELAMMGLLENGNLEHRCTMCRGIH